MEAEKRLKDFALADADQIAVLAFVEPYAEVGERLESGSEAAFGTASALGHSAKAAVIPGEQGDEAVGVAERVGAEDDGFRVVERHALARARALKKEKINTEGTEARRARSKQRRNSS